MEGKKMNEFFGVELLGIEVRSMFMPFHFSLYKGAELLRRRGLCILEEQNYKESVGSLRSNIAKRGEKMSSYKSHEPQSSPLLFKSFPRKKRTPRRATRLNPLWLSSPFIKGGSTRRGKTVLPHQPHMSSETLTLELGDGETYVLKNTARNRDLAEVARVDPESVKRVLAHRESSARSKGRKKIRDTEKEVEKVQQILNALYLQLTQMKADPHLLGNFKRVRRIEFRTLSKLVEVEKARNEAIQAKIRMLKEANAVPRKARVGVPSEASPSEKA